MSRRLVLAAVTVVLLAAAAVAFIAAGDGGHEGAQPAAAAGIQRFLTRPELRPAAVTVKTPPSGTHPGFLFMAPKGGKSQNGPMIADGEGRLVWFSPRPKGVLADDFRVQRYRGRPVLTWWEGRTNPKGYGAGSYVIADASYHEIARVRAGNGLQGDLHEFRRPPRGTALITISPRVPADLTAVGGKRDGTMLDSVVQEVDVATGRVRFQWHSRGHVPITDSYAKPPTARQDFAYDYFHVNSVSLDRDRNYL